MNPYEAARLEAASLRRELAGQGDDLSVGGYALVRATCKRLGVALREVKPDFHLLRATDATILVDRKLTLVRNDKPNELKAFLVAHELGHLRLHPTSKESPGVTEDALTGATESHGAIAVESYGAREREELQANVFAREFLMPRALARDAFLNDGIGAKRLADLRELPLELVRLQLYDGVLLPIVEKPAKVYKLPEKPTDAQKPAVDSDAPVSLVEAGPGTGKTTALLLRLRRLVSSGVAPDEIVILTFSNKAARELVERARAGGIPGADRVWIGTFHAFGLEFLRKFGHVLGLGPRFPVLDKLAALAMLEQDIHKSELQHYDPLSNPSHWLAVIVDAIRRSKDEFYDAQKFEAAVKDAPTEDQDIAGKLCDTATIFRKYEALLAKRGAVDLADLLCATIRLIQSGNPAVDHFLRGIKHLMVDEYQDVNRASSLLVQGLAKKCSTVWVVGDANQAIYAFMGASSSNLASFQQDFPSAVSIPLALNHRSSQEIVDAFDVVASRNPAQRPTHKQVAEYGYASHNPQHIQTRDEAEQIRALAWRIQTLKNEGTPLVEQAVITYKNSVAADIAQGLEQLGVPVLFLGNIFERGEVKDLICLLQLAVDDGGTNLLRTWNAPCLGLSRAGADTIFKQAAEERVSWCQVSGGELCAGDHAAWQNLVRLCALIEASASPWEALSEILLEDGQWLRELARSTDQSAANALMAVWQFVFFCRTPDGTGRWATLKNLPPRIRDRLRLNEDRSMRSVPPEAEGMDAVRVLTAHGSKGLEFDAVHFVDVKSSTYAPEVRPRSNKHIPTAVLDGAKSLDVHRNERHNLLYVAVSRPRKFLTVYTTHSQELAPALSGLLTSLDGGWNKSEAVVASRREAIAGVEVSLKEFLEFNRCARQSETTSRGGRWQREDMKLHRAVDLATTRAVDALAADGALLREDRWREVAEQAIAHFGLDKEDAADLIRLRVHLRVERGRDWLLEGGTEAPEMTVVVGPLKVGFRPDQVIQVAGKKTLRFIKPNAKSLDSLKQPLATLLRLHNSLGGEQLDIQVATLSDGQLKSVGGVKKDTPAKYEAKAHSLCAGNFTGIPENGHTCYSCPYLFPCNKRPAEDE